MNLPVLRLKCECSFLSAQLAWTNEINNKFITRALAAVRQLAFCHKKTFFLLNCTAALGISYIINKTLRSMLF